MKRWGIVVTLLVAAPLVGLAAWDPLGFFQSSTHTSAKPTSPIPEKPPADVVRVTPEVAPTDPFPEKVTLDDGNRKVDLYYTGEFQRVRPILFVNLDVYDIASYVERKPPKAETDALLGGLLEPDQAKVYLLRFRRRLAGSIIHTAIEEEITRTFADVDMPRLRPNIDRFTAPFAQGTSSGDVVYLAWLPEGRAYSGYREAHNMKLIADDLPLARAIWRIWAGEAAGPERVGLVQKYASDVTTR